MKLCPENKKKLNAVKKSLLLGLLIIFGVYSMIRLTSLWISADYYFPFLKLARRMENRIADQSSLAQNKRSQIRALPRMLHDNVVLSTERSIISDLKKELNRKTNGFRPVFAEVIQRDPMTWQEEFTIDQGARAGIRPGNLVVTPVYSSLSNMPRIAAIGKVKSVTGHTALVSTVMSRDFHLSVSLPDSKTSGILEGTRNSSGMQATLKFLPLHTVPAAGQTVYTNAFSGSSPPGLPVGIVAAESRSVQDSHRNQLYLETAVRPFESPAEVRFAAVFVKEKK